MRDLKEMGLGDLVSRMVVAYPITTMLKESEARAEAIRDYEACRRELNYRESELRKLIPEVKRLSSHYNLLRRTDSGPHYP